MIRRPHTPTRFRLRVYTPARPRLRLRVRRAYRPWIVAAVIPLAILPLAACSGVNDPHRGHNGIDISVAPFTPIPDGATYTDPPDESATTQTTPSDTTDTDAYATLAPDNSTPDERIPDIVRRGRIIVGVSSSLNFLGFQDPSNGNLEGFDVALAREIARDIFGDPERIDFRFLSSAERVDALQHGNVDIVVRTMTIDRERQSKVAFSAPYLHAQARILASTSSPIQSANDLRDATVCVTKDSTFQHNAQVIAPHSRFLITNDWSDCLVAMQQHQVQAIISDDSILSGLAAQDSNTHLVGQPYGSSDYAVGIAKSTPGKNTDGLVRQVNSTLMRIRSDGTWQRLYDKWLGSYLGDSGVPPEPTYVQEEPQ
ncbi:glutamate ABC transporter substrate-binding protein [uncultured Corynebacterium sp.]|uniref:glutamate ABC transporter substrate-binding protein n=1 Tax=uncultured Corynebacterium sp. TaxID=159447 RepID=UPI0025EC02F2|nr:glutamate ABC transporter substrate-binding protein [uncultured Corynebacterium sp.]